MKKRRNTVKTKSQYFPEILVVFVFAFVVDVAVVVAAVVFVAIAFLLVCFISNDQFFVSAF